MKRFVLSVLTVLALGTLASCGSTLKLKGEEPVMNIGRPEVIDYQGLALGSAVPEWVIATLAILPEKAVELWISPVDALA